MMVSTCLHTACKVVNASLSRAFSQTLHRQSLAQLPVTRNTLVQPLPYSLQGCPRRSCGRPAASRCYATAVDLQDIEVLVETLVETDKTRVRCVCPSPTLAASLKEHSPTSSCCWASASMQSTALLSPGCLSALGHSPPRPARPAAKFNLIPIPAHHRQGRDGRDAKVPPGVAGGRLCHSARRVCP